MSSYLSPQFKYMIFHNSFAFFYGYITNSQFHQLPDGFIAQLVQHHTSIAEVTGLNPIQAELFSGLISQLLNLCV